MGIYCQLFPVGTSRGESLCVPIQGRCLSLAAFLFQFLPEAHPPADRCSSPWPARPTAPLHRESPLQEDTQLSEEENAPTHAGLVQNPQGAF